MVLLDDVSPGGLEATRYTNSRDPFVIGKVPDRKMQIFPWKTLCTLPLVVPKSCPE